MSATHKPELAVPGLERPAGLERPRTRRTLPHGPRERCRLLGLGLLARCRALSLDRRLAAGESPVQGALAARARMITARRSRRRLAGGLQRVLRESLHPAHGFSSAAPLETREVLAARIVVEAIIARLQRVPDEPVRARGAAMLELLLSDPAGPLYRLTEPGSLGSELRAVAAALEPSHQDVTTP